MERFLSNLDVLTLVAEMLFPEDAISFSSTCRTFRAIARRHAFSEITIHSPEQLVRMHDYLVAHHNDCRTIMPRRLNLNSKGAIYQEYFTSCDDDVGIRWTYARKGPTYALAGILGLAHNLVCLHFSGCERALKKDAELRDALASLPGLLEVSLSNAGFASMRVIRRMASHPKIMTISLQEGLFDDTVDTDIIRRLLHANVLRDVQDLTLQGFQVEELSMDLGDRDPMSPLSTLHLTSLSLIQCDVLPLLALFPSVRRLNVHRCTYSTAVGALKLRHLKETHLSTPLEDLHQILIPSSYVLNLSSLSRTRRSPLGAKLPLDSNMRISHAAVLHLSVDSADSASVLGSIMEIISRRCSRVRYLILRFTSKEAAMRCAVSHSSWH